MGYDLHITRAESWAENQDDHITANEWLNLVATDEELTLDARNGPYFAAWSGDSAYHEPWFNWSDGNIETRYPDRLMLAKMLQMAESLGAKVQGDDGELYESMDDLPEFLPSEMPQPGDGRRAPAFLRREYLWNIAAFITIAIVITAVNVLDLW